MDLEKIQSLIKFVAKSGVDEVELETDDFKISIKSPSIAKKKTGQTGEVETQIIQTPMAVPQMQPVVQQQQPVAQQPQAAAPDPPADTAPPSEDNSKYIEVKSPMIGTFYRSSSPDKPPFINVGDSIKEGDVTCIIEAMKLFNEIESEVSGKIVKVIADDATPVEYDQVLYLVDPS